MQAEARETGAPIGRAPSLPRPRYFTDVIDAVRRNGPAIAGFTIPFLIVLYLALQGGGYDAVVRGEVGIAVWWRRWCWAPRSAPLPVARVTPAGWAALGLLLAFGAWTAIGIGGSESSERTVAEVGRIGVLLGRAGALIVCAGTRGASPTVYAVGAALAVVGMVALPRASTRRGSRTSTPPRALLPGRLDYPLNYWNGLAALMAIGIPLLLYLAAEARLLLARRFAAAAIPVISLTAFFTLSRGGAGEIAIALIALLALHPRRLCPSDAAGRGAGSAILIAAANQRDAVDNGTRHGGQPGRRDARDGAFVCAGVGLLAGRSARRAHGIGPRLGLPPARPPRARSPPSSV